MHSYFWSWYRAKRTEWLFAFIVALSPLLIHAQEVTSPDETFRQAIAAARLKTPAACKDPQADRLVRILCEGKIRLGVREGYPLFSTGSGQARQGYDVDVAKAIADKLGVTAEFIKVTPANRISLLAEDRIDLVIATMGHNTQRDSQARFIRPHYYQSESIIVGPKNTLVREWDDVRGKAVCVTIGNGSNAELVAHKARIMLFETAGVLPEKLLDGTCTLAAQDDSFFAESFAKENFSSRFDSKFGFSQVPWGMAVANKGSDGLAQALDSLSQIYHRDGIFLAIAQKNSIDTAFLRKQQVTWQSSSCNTASGKSNSECVLPALNAVQRPTAFVKNVSAFEEWYKTATGNEISLPMFKLEAAWETFQGGLVNSLILIIGALCATFGFSLAFGAALSSTALPLRWSAKCVAFAFQSSPIVLTLVIFAAIANVIMPFSGALALTSAILALGMSNGSNAGQAISEAVDSLKAEGIDPQVGEKSMFRLALSRSATQIVAFLVNAAKGTPIASFVGAPELLSSLTDIQSFSSGRSTTYWILLIFYTAIIMVVVWFCGKLRELFERKYAA